MLGCNAGTGNRREFKFYKQAMAEGCMPVEPSLKPAVPSTAATMQTALKILPPADMDTPYTGGLALNGGMSPLSWEQTTMPTASG